MFVYAYGAINDPCVFAIFADWRQVALEIDACRTDVTSLGWGGVGMLTFMWKELGKLAKKSRR